MVNAKPNDSTPFDFNLDTVKAETELTPFRVNWSGKCYKFTHIQELDVWQLVAAAEQGELAATMSVFKSALGDKQYEAFRKHAMPQYKLQALFTAYQKHCGLESGE